MFEAMSGRTAEDWVRLSAERIAKARRTEVRQMPGHRCDRARCRPMSERDLWPDARDKPVHKDVFVCSHGTVHVCTPAECDVALGGVCPLTGRTHGDASAEPRVATAIQDAWSSVGPSDSPEEEQPREAVSVDPATRIDEDQQRERAEVIVVHLLYSSTRQRLNEAKRQSLDTQRDHAVQAYYAECRQRRTFPIMVEVVNKRAGFDMRLPHMEILKRDQRRIDHCVDMVMHTWRVLVQSPYGRSCATLRFESHVLATLYRMRSGLVIGGVDYIPRDLYMTNLPLRNDLPLFGKPYSSSSVTAGIKSLLAAYRSCVDAGWSIQRLLCPR